MSKTKQPQTPTPKQIKPGVKRTHPWRVGNFRHEHRNQRSWLDVIR